MISIFMENLSHVSKISKVLALKLVPRPKLLIKLCKAIIKKQQQLTATTTKAAFICIQQEHISGLGPLWKKQRSLMEF